MVRQIFDTALDESHDRRSFAVLLSGHATGTPFVAEVLNKARARLHQFYEQSGIDSRRQEEDQPGKISFRLLQGLLLVVDDPGAEVFGTYATGVRVGVGVRMSRTPAVYDPKQKWKLPGQRDAHLYREELNGSGVEQGNCKSAEAFPEEVER